MKIKFPWWDLSKVVGRIIDSQTKYIPSNKIISMINDPCDRREWIENVGPFSLLVFFFRRSQSIFLSNPNWMCRHNFFFFFIFGLSWMNHDSWSCTFRLNYLNNNFNFVCFALCQWFVDCCCFWANINNKPAPYLLFYPVSHFIIFIIKACKRRFNVILSFFMAHFCTFKFGWGFSEMGSTKIWMTQ